MDEQIVGCSYNGILYNSKKWTMNAHNNLDEYKNMLSQRSQTNEREYNVWFCLLILFMWTGIDDYRS